MKNTYRSHIFAEAVIDWSIDGFHSAPFYKKETCQKLLTWAKHIQDNSCRECEDYFNNRFAKIHVEDFVADVFEELSLHSKSFELDTLLRCSTYNKDVLLCPECLEQTIDGQRCYNDNCDLAYDLAEIIFPLYQLVPKENHIYKPLKHAQLLKFTEK